MHASNCQCLFKYIMCLSFTCVYHISLCIDFYLTIFSFLISLSNANLLRSIAQFDELLIDMLNQNTNSWSKFSSNPDIVDNIWAPNDRPDKCPIELPLRQWTIKFQSSRLTYPEMASIKVHLISY